MRRPFAALISALDKRTFRTILSGPALSAGTLAWVFFGMLTQKNEGAGRGKSRKGRWREALYREGMFTANPERISESRRPA